MLTFVCLKAGTAFGPEYVNILRDMVIRNLAEGVIDKFVCLTDDPTGLDSDINVIPLPDDLETWWGKLYLFKQGLFQDGERIVFMDLDTVITGRLDDIFAYQGKYAALRDFYQPEKLASGVMLWEAGSQSIWETWEEAGRPRNDGGDQWWVGRVAEVDYLQDIFPGKFVSYKADCQVSPPNNSAVVCFHGVPRPHQVNDWVAKFWKIGGYSSAEFDVICNTELSKVVDNIKYSSNLDIPCLKLLKENGRMVVICGGGPSLVDSLDEIRKQQEDGAFIVGLNGSAQWLKDNGVIPDLLVMIDARESNVKFVERKPAQRYLLSSQCHPIVFDSLRDEDVALFHIDIPNIGEYVPNNGKPIQAVGGGSTVGLIALSVVYTQGYRNMHLYGYDSSFKEEQGHAYPQSQNDAVIEVDVAGRNFKSTPWMVTQTTQFAQLAPQLRALGCTVSIHGSGLLPYLAWVTMLQEQNTENAADIRAREILSRVPVNAIGAEIGVFAGELSARLLARGDIYLNMVDSWICHGNGQYADSGDFHATLTQEQQDGYKQMAINNTEFASDRRTIYPMSSISAAQSVLSGSLDFVFIDADHSYEGCKADLEAWFCKVKPGGLFCGHDYNNVNCQGFGVNQAVDEFVMSHGLVLELGDNFTWFTRTPSTT